MKILVSVQTLSAGHTSKEYELFELKDKYEQVDIELTTYRIWKQIYDRYPEVKFDLVDEQVRKIAWKQQHHFSTTDTGLNWRRRTILRKDRDFNTEYKDFSLTVLTNDEIHLHPIVTKKIFDFYKTLNDPSGINYKSQYEIYVRSADGVYHIKDTDRHFQLEINKIEQDDEKMRLFFRLTDPVTFASANALVRKHKDVLVIGKDYLIRSEHCLNSYTYNSQVIGNKRKQYRDLNGVEYDFFEGRNDCICAPRAEVLEKMILA